MTPAEARVVDEVVSGWSPRLALFNLLLHPAMLPPKKRLWVLVHAISQRDDAWLTLAGAVGIAGLGQSVPKEAWEETMRFSLLGVLERTDDPLLRNRLILALVAGARKGDGTILMSAARSGRDARDLFPAMLRIGADADALRIVPAVLANGGLDPSSHAWLEEWVSSGRRPKTAVPALLLLYTFGYIPNLPPENSADRPSASDRPESS
jgi:hypothetical protein